MFVFSFFNLPFSCNVLAHFHLEVGGDAHTEAEAIGAVRGLQLLLASVERQRAEVVGSLLVGRNEDALRPEALVAIGAEEGGIERFYVETDGAESLGQQFETSDSVQAEMLELQFIVLSGKQVPAPLESLQSIGFERAFVGLRVGELPVGAGKDAVLAQSRADDVQVLVSARNDDGLHPVAQFAKLLQEKAFEDVRNESARHSGTFLLVGSALPYVVSPDVLAAVARIDVDVHRLADEGQILDEHFAVVACLAVALDAFHHFLASDALGVLEHLFENEIMSAFQFHN